MFFPYKDDNPRILIPYVTYGIIAVNVFIFAFQFSLNFLTRNQPPYLFIILG